MFSINLYNMFPPSLKNDFPIFQHFPKLIYLDSAATAQKPRLVIEAEKLWYEQYNANVHRGVYRLAEEATNVFEKSREAIARFIGAVSKQNIIFTKGATEGINLVAYAFARTNLTKGDVILLTEMEHHANLVPWQILAKEKGINLRFWPIDSQGRLVFDDLEKLFAGVSFLSVTHVSNVLGTVNPIKKIIQLAHKQNIPVLVDAAQSAPHLRLNMRSLDPDFLVFSGHKCLGPTGIGVLYVKQSRYAKMQPYQAGGEMIYEVSQHTSSYTTPPWKFEAGTQPLAQVFGLAAAVEYLEKLGMKHVQRHIHDLVTSAYRRLCEIPEVILYGPKNSKSRCGLISFNVKGIHAHDLATFIDQQNIAIRSGHHCAQPLHTQLAIDASARVSFHIYNSQEDVDRFISALVSVIQQWHNSTRKK